MRFIYHILLLCIFFAHTLHADFPVDLSQLNQNLSSLAQNLSEVPTAPIPPAPTRLPATQALVDTISSLQINNTQSLLPMSGTIKDLLLSQKYHVQAPAATQLPITLSSNATLFQLIVAWQDLAFATLLGKDKEFAHALAFAESLGFNKNTISQLVDTLRNFNQPVMQQFTGYEKVEPDDIPVFTIGGGAASCGYHALKNALTIINSCFSDSSTIDRTVTLITNLALVDYLFGTPKQREFFVGQQTAGAWRAFMVQHATLQFGEVTVPTSAPGPRDEPGDWLTEPGLGYFWQNYQPHQNDTIDSLIFQSKQKVPQELFIKIPSYKVNDIKKRYQAAPTTLIPCIILVDGNHWITLIINKVNQVTQFIILDSKNKPRYHEKTIQKIISELLGVEYI